MANGTVAAVLLLAVLTRIPYNAEQRALLGRLRAKLRPGGVRYISDYYLRPDRAAAGGYTCPAGDPTSEGVFTLPEGATLRHHTRAWAQGLAADFTVLHTALVPVFILIGNHSEAVQLVLQEPAR